jgi:benzoyl-CoA reductase subunit D
MSNSTKDTKTVYAAGIDVGSSVVKVAIIKDDGQGGIETLKVLSERLRRRTPAEVATRLYAEALRDASLEPEQIEYVATTGEGDELSFRTGHFYGMTTHARGGNYLDPEARAVIDIGALHTRAVLMDEKSKVLGYRMTSQCASGSGRFLENIGRYLGVTTEEIGPLSLQGENPEKCSSICAVLAETDVINMVSRAISVPNILKGIHQSMAGRYMRLLVSSGASGKVLVTGGLSMDVGMVEAMRELSGKQKVRLEIRTHPQSIFAGALGAAIWGAFRARKLKERGQTEVLAGARASV